MYVESSQVKAQHGMTRVHGVVHDASASLPKD